MTDEPVGPNAHVICIVGDLDAATHGSLEDAVARIIEDGRTRVVVDLSEVTFLDSSGLSGLFACARRLRRPNSALAVVLGRYAQPRARFELTGTREVLNVCESRDEALALVERAGPASERATPPSEVRLRLYVNGDSPNSKRAIASLDRLRRRLPGGADVEVVDISADPEMAEREHLLAVPTLVRTAPAPVRRIIGDLSDHEQVLFALDLAPASRGRA